MLGFPPVKFALGNRLLPVTFGMADLQIPLAQSVQCHAQRVAGERRPGGSQLLYGRIHGENKPFIQCHLHGMHSECPSYDYPHYSVWYTIGTIPAMLTIRPATADDLPAVLPMVGKTCAFHQRIAPAKYPFRPEPEKGYIRWLASQIPQPRSVFLVAALEQRIAGFLIATVETEIPIYTVREYGFIHDVWVEEDARRHGVGRALILEVVARFRAMGIPQIRLDVVATNTPAEKLFASCGFAVATKEMIAEL